MRVLLLGGTIFLGPHLIDAALARGHEVCLFHRGLHPLDAHPALPRLKGDRLASDLSALREGSWDVVIDTCAYVPRVVREALDALGDRAPYVQLVSSISVYDLPMAPGADEDTPRAALPEGTSPDAEVVDGRTYGPLKALCEDALLARGADRGAVIRPGLIVGPLDPTDRFTYWPWRVAQGGQVLAPEGPDAPVQIIDARDLAAWMIRLAEARTCGVFNATSPDGMWTMGDVLQTCREVSGSAASWAWRDLDALARMGVRPWVDLPAWAPDAGESAGMSRVSVQRALDAGLTLRPLADTVRDTLAWFDALDPARTPRAGLSLDREAQALADHPG